MPRRTKACAICRQKRIKCDATMPQCLMCIRFKRQCPGPTDAPLLFIDTSFYPSGKKPRKKKPDVDSTPSALSRSRAVTNWETISEVDDASDEESRGLPEELAHVMLVQVTPRYILNEAFFANLVCFFCAEGRHIPGSVRRTPSWLHALPTMAMRSSAKLDDDNGLGLAIRATTAAFSGIESRNMGLLEYASGLYGGALRSQGRVLQTKGMKGVGMEMVATSVMLSMFEAVVATTGQAYAAHIVGASKMIETALAHAPKPVSGGSPHQPGPGAGRGGGPLGAGKGRPSGGGPPGGGAGPGPLLTNMFFHIRIQLAFVYLTTTNWNIRNDPVMKTVLMDACGWPPSVLPLNMQILVPLARLSRLSFDRAASARDGIDNTQEYNKANQEVHKLWQEYEGTTNKGPPLTWTNHDTGHTDFRDPFTALNYAYFSACRILLDLTATTAASQRKLSVASAISIPASSAGSTTSTIPIRTSSPSSSSGGSPASSATSASSTSPYMSSNFLPPATTDHYALILSVAWYLRLRDVGFSYLRLHLPLFLVAMYAPLEEQRKMARMIFEEWRVGALKGIGTLGLERIYEADAWTNKQNLVG